MEEESLSPVPVIQVNSQRPQGSKSPFRSPIMLARLRQDRLLNDDMGSGEYQASGKFEGSEEGKKWGENEAPDCHNTD